MPWNILDVDRHKKGLSDSQKERWIKIANTVLKGCKGKDGLSGFDDCDSKAIIIANTHIGSKKTRESTLDPIQTFLLEFSNQPIRALLMYLHKKIIPIYKKFDKSHQIEHVLGVIKWSSRIVNELSNKFPIDINLMYTVAAFHDTGLKFGMNNHIKNVIKVIDEYKEDLSVWFSEKDIKDIVEACLYYESKGNKKPKNIYGIILHDAIIIQDKKDSSLLMLPDSKNIIDEKKKFTK